MQQVYTKQHTFNFQVLITSCDLCGHPVIPVLEVCLSYFIQITIKKSFMQLFIKIYYSMLNSFETIKIHDQQIQFISQVHVDLMG